MRRLIPLLGVIFVTAVVGCGSGGGKATGYGAKVGTKPFSFGFQQNGKTLADEAKGSIWFELASNGDWRNLTNVISHTGDSWLVGTNDGSRTATVTITRRTTGIHVHVALHPTTNVQQVYDSFGASSSDHFLGAGERTSGPDLAGQVVQVKVGSCAYAPVPYFASSAGWGLRVTSENVAAFAFPGTTGGPGTCDTGTEAPCTFGADTSRVSVCVKGATLDEDLYGGTFAQTLADYEADTGKPDVPPADELALIKWRDEVSGPGQVLDDITRLQQAKIPMGWVLLDNPWEDCNGALTFSPYRIPNPAALIREVHARGVKFMLWVSPKATCSDGYPANGILRTDPNDPVLDLRDPQVVKIFERRIRALLALGVDGVKGDRGDEVDFEPLDPSLTNDYPLLFERAVMNALGPTRAAIFRAGTAGSQAVVPGLWAGDQEGSYAGLQNAIYSAESAGSSGFTTWGSDIGGYTSGDGTIAQETPDVFIRWAQLGAISPVMEVGGIGLNATPWLLGTAAMNGLRAAAVLHYELFPYLYGLLQQGQPVLRPLGFDYPDDPAAWKADLELMVGPNLLAAPVTSLSTTTSIYLPAGAWIDLATGATVKGGAAFDRVTPLTELPLYAKAGTVIPFDLRTAKGSWWGVNELSHPGRAGSLASNGTQLDLTGQPGQVQLFVPASARPKSVTLGGKAVAWTWAAGPDPGVVIRLHGPVVRGQVELASS